jgi:primosomal protein N' (replication factor Y)
LAGKKKTGHEKTGHETPAGRIVRVAVPKPLHQLFDYSLAEAMTAPVAGARVRVPFGRQQLTGVCVALDPPDAHAEPRPLTAVLDDVNVFGTDLYELALWMADYYHHPLGEVLGTLMPAEVRRGADLDAPVRASRPDCWALTEAHPDAGRAPRQRALLQFLQERGGSATPDEIEAGGFGTALVRGLAAKGIVARRTLEMRAEVVVADRLTLNAEQRSVVGELLPRLDRFGASLLEGVTGSGKTEIYLQLIEAVVARGAQVLVLVPEIALTPQTLERFRNRFGIAAALHSGMTDAQRLRVWLGCRAGTVPIVIGTRSAVLTPFQRLGLIVVDEEHDASFKQQEGLRYSARDVAAKRAQGLGIPLLLGSATPSFESLVNATTGRYRHLRLQHRAGGARMPEFRLIDIRGHSLRDGISNTLANATRAHLGAGGQVLLFLNRRGYAPSFVCTACGWQAECRQCEMRMTLHRDPAALVCHYCSLRMPVPAACPRCASRALLGFGLGTQRTETALVGMFPGVPVYRVDRDTARSQRRLEAHFRAIHSGAPAILVGTQMLAKGHHFPAVTLVGVINADSGFLSADFRAPERTAQLIVQVAGRAGRAERPGEVWIQTCQPESPALLSLIEEGYPGFAARELEHRRASELPPYRAMALVRAEGPDAVATQGFLSDLRPQLQPSSAADSSLEILGPVAAPIQRVANRFRFQLLALAGSRRVLHEALRRIEALRPAQRGMRWSIDVDPYDAF